MAFNMFLKIDGIDGESTDDKHKGWIDLQSFDWGVTANIANGGAGGGGRVGRPTFSDVKFTAAVSKASPYLFRGCATGVHFKSAQLEVVKSGEERFVFYKVGFSEVLITSYESTASAASDLLPLDLFSLNFTKIDDTYVTQGNDGGVGATFTTSFDIRQNRSA